MLFAEKVRKNGNENLLLMPRRSLLNELLLVAATNPLRLIKFSDDFSIHGIVFEMLHRLVVNDAVSRLLILTSSIRRLVKRLQREGNRNKRINF